MDYSHPQYANSTSRVAGEYLLIRCTRAALVCSSSAEKSVTSRNLFGLSRLALEGEAKPQGIRAVVGERALLLGKAHSCYCERAALAWVLQRYPVFAFPARKCASNLVS